MESAEAVGQRVPGGQEQDRRCDTTRAQRLADVASVRVGQSDVEHEDVGRVVPEARTASAPEAVARTANPSRSSASRTTPRSSSSSSQTPAVTVPGMA